MRVSLPSIVLNHQLLHTADLHVVRGVVAVQEDALEPRPVLPARS